MAAKIYFLNRLSVITVALIYCLTSSFCKQQVPAPNVHGCTSGSDCWNRDSADDGTRILTRKKRSLTFPEGSSLQLVYDQTIPVVGAQLLFTVGVTCALAFELPSEPIYHITQKLRDNLYGIKDEEETTTPAPASSAENDTDTDDGHSRIDYNHKQLNYINSNKQNYYDSMNKHNYYYSGNYNSDKYYQKPLSPNYYISDKSDNYNNNYSQILSNQQHQSSVYVTPVPLNTTKSLWTSVIKSFVNKYGQKVLTKKIKPKKGKKKLGNVFLRKHNRIYPVFGKRSVDDHLSDEDKFYMEHHRTTRFALYEKIEGFLKGRDKDGKSCVLKALCETGQKNQSREKGPFLLEILRAVFSLPHQVEPLGNDSHQSFDDAHSELEADCSKLYPNCDDSIWSPEFRF